MGEGRWNAVFLQAKFRSTDRALHRSPRVFAELPGMNAQGMTAVPRRRPRGLRPGDGIALVAPARFAPEERIAEAAEAIRAAGFTPILPPGLSARHHSFGGTDAHRAHVLNTCFRDPAVRAVWALRGGYGSARLLPLLDAAAFQADPKWVMGFSDITALHAWADRLGVASLHAPVALTHRGELGEMVAAAGAARDIAAGAARDQRWEIGDAAAGAAGDPAASPREDGVVVGGNLSVLYSLLGTPYFPDVRGCVLLLEDLDEYLYHLDRMLLAFRLAGIWEQVAGVAVGSFTDIRDNTRAFGQSVDNPFGRSVQEIFEDQIRPQHPDLPIVWDLPVGHGPVNRPVVLGCGGWILAKFAQNTTDVRSISGSFENPAEGD